MKKRNIKKRYFRCGLENVEAAMLLPFILLVTFGALKYGWILLKNQQLTNAARQIARVAIRPDDRTAEITSLFTTLMTDAGIGRR